MQPSSGTEGTLVVWAVPKARRSSGAGDKAGRPGVLPAAAPAQQLVCSLTTWSQILVSVLFLCYRAGWAYTAKGWEGSARNCNKESCLMFSWIGCWIDLLIFNSMVFVSFFINLQKISLWGWNIWSWIAASNITFFFFPTKIIWLFITTCEKKKNTVISHVTFLKNFFFLLQMLMSLPLKQRLEMAVQKVLVIGFEGRRVAYESQLCLCQQCENLRSNQTVCS